MSTTVTPKPGNQLWGIYHTDREYARELSDPLRTTIEAPTKIAAEEAAAQLGFSDPWAHPDCTRSCEVDADRSQKVSKPSAATRQQTFTRH
jgi:hypothetical protein